MLHISVNTTTRKKKSTLLKYLAIDDRNLHQWCASSTRKMVIVRRLLQTKVTTCSALSHQVAAHGMATWGFERQAHFLKQLRVLRLELDTRQTILVRARSGDSVCAILPPGSRRIKVFIFCVLLKTLPDASTCDRHCLSETGSTG